MSPMASDAEFAVRIRDLDIEFDTDGGLVTALTDGHPGVSGGGVLDQRGNLVGIPIGRMQGDYRFSFILPIRPEMLRKLPSYEQPEPPRAVVAAAEQP